MGRMGRSVRRGSLRWGPLRFGKGNFGKMRYRCIFSAGFEKAYECFEPV